MIFKGITFNEIDSFLDLNLVLSSKSIPPAQPKTNYVDLPGGDGSLDLTEAHGEIKYNDRDLIFEFTIHPAEVMTFEEKVTQVSNALNGRYFERITNLKDPEYYYSGRVSVNEYMQDKNIGTITISAKVKPYKMQHTETEVSVQLSGEYQGITLENGRKPVIPEIICTGETKLIFEGSEFTLSAGTHNILEVYLKSGANTVQVKGAGKITFKWRKGEL